MRICVLDDEYDYPAWEAPLEDWRVDPTPFLKEHEWTVEALTKDTAVLRLNQLARKGFDVFFNLCAGAWDEESPGIEVVQALERLNVPFTGATSEFYEPSRESMKRVCSAWGIGFPDYVLAKTEEDIDRAADTLPFPLIVKQAWTLPRTPGWKPASDSATVRDASWRSTAPPSSKSSSQAGSSPSW